MNDTDFAPCKTCQHCSRLGNPPTCDILGRLVDPGLLYTCERAGYYEKANHHFRACTGGKDQLYRNGPVETFWAGKTFSL